MRAPADRHLRSRPRRSTAVLAPALAVTLLAVAGCTSVVDRAIDRAAMRTGEGIGDAVGTRVGQMAGAYVASRIPAVWTPDLSALYVNYLLAVAFHSGGYTFTGAAYEPGDWTRWRLVSADSEEGTPPEIERAFLAEDDQNRQWWRLKYLADTEGDQGAQRDSLTVEMLFDRETGQVLRMRGRMPGDSEAKEMAVQEGTYTFVEPIRLTAESLEGATVGSERVSVPAGSFTADHVRYGDIAAGTMEWWLVDSGVPGRMVRYLRSHDGDGTAEGPDPRQYTVELVRYGSDARSELGVLE